MEKQIPLEEIATAAANGVRHSMNFCLPGSVVAFYPNDTPTPTADVQPMLTDPRVDLDTGAILFEPWEIVQRVPVAYLRGGGFVCAFPLLAGDPVVLQAFDLDPTPWRANGRGTKPLNPGDVRRHGGGYWRCVPTDLAGPLTATLGNAMVLGKDGDQAQILIEPGSIQLGATGGDHVALASKIDGVLNGIVSGLNTAAGAPLTGTSLAAIFTAAWGGTPAAPSSPPSTTGSSLIKAQ